MSRPLDLGALQRLVARSYLTESTSALGSSGPTFVNKLINGVRSFFKELPPDQISTRLVFIAGFSELPSPCLGHAARIVAKDVICEDLAMYRMHVREAHTVVTVVRESGQFDLYEFTDPLDDVELSAGTVIFVNHDNADQFVINGKKCPLEQLVPGSPSQFAVPIVRDLDEALRRYQERVIQSSCRILSEVWDGGLNGPRIVFKNKPEATMRSSLASFLQNHLRDVSVREEHLTDETKPVDIIVNWYGSRMRALIEVKWLGKALSAHASRDKFTVYHDARAQDGLNQLVDYMDRELSSDSMTELRGYVAVFDGRRRGVNSADMAISSADAGYYRSRDIKLTRDYSCERSDVAPLVRYFLEARSLHFSPQ